MGGWRGAAAVFLVAVLARAVLLAALDGGAGRPLEGDERDYAAAAGSLARGEGFGYTVAGVTAEGEPFRRRLLAFRAPLLPAVLAPVHLASGGSPAALRAACAVLGALAAAVAFAAAGRIGGPRAAWIAGLAVALWPSQAWLSARVLSEPLDALLLLAAADLLLRRRAAAGGAALGLAILCRPGGLPAALLAAGVAAGLEAPGRRLRTAAVVLGAAAALVLPWAARNRVTVGATTLATTSGLTLIGGNCDAALAAEHPGKWVPPERAWTAPDPPDLGPFGWSRLGEAESSARFAAAARAWVAEDPVRAAGLAAWKVVRFLDPDTRSSKSDAALKSVVGWISWGPLLLATALALAAGARARTPEWRMAAALLLGHLLVAAAVYGDARMRAPVEPALLALLAAPLLAAGAAKWTSRGAAATVPA